MIPPVLSAAFAVIVDVHKNVYNRSDYVFYVFHLYTPSQPEYSMSSISS